MEHVFAPRLRYDNGHLVAVTPFPVQRDPLEGYAASFQTWCDLVMADWSRNIQHTWKLMVAAARYGAQDIETMKDWPISEVVRVVRLLGDLLEKENPDPTRPNSAASGAW